ncbi:MAG: hypothetical protein ACFCGT_13075 [Sandaracinaceae bacterium]
MTSPRAPLWGALPRAAWPLVLGFALAACGSSSEPPDPDAGRVEAPDDGPAADPDLGPPGVDAGRDPSACEPAQVSGDCGPQGIVRTRITLTEEAQQTITAPIVVNFFHYRLGQGAAGGVPHWTARSAGAVDLEPGVPVEIHFDHCRGGEMWSEDNCEYNLWAFADLNNDGALQVGEPAGRILMELSCVASHPACEDVVLDCPDGMACVAFDEPPACACGAEDVCAATGSRTRIITCQ